MANLETLELTISATSESASKGIDNLVDSLTVLRNEVGKNIGALVRLNQEIGRLKQFRKGFSFVNDKKSNTKKATEAIVNSSIFGRQPTADEIRRSIAEQEAKRKAAALPPEAVAAQQALSRQKIQDRMATTAMQRQQFEQKRLAEESKKAASAVQSTTKAITETAKAANEARPKVSAFGKLMEQIGRIAKTLLIRTALRALIKSFSETWSAAYEYSRRMGGDFAKNVERARGAIASISTSLITTFSPVLNALIPIINTITAGITYLANALQNLFKWLGMGSDLFGVSAKSIDKYSNSATSGASKTKNLLASWDQLNVITSTSSGGGGGGGAKSFLSDMVSEEMAKINIIVAESMMGIGLILACTGHVGLGIGMMAIGAGAFAKTMLEDWNKLPSRVKRTIAEITIVTGIGMLAVGMMALCAGNIPLGIGMLAIGAASIGVTMFAGKDEPIGSEVRKTITETMALASVSMMAIGLIIAIAGNVPLGLGLMVAGAASWAAASAYDPQGLQNTVKGVLDSIGKFFSDTWEGIKGVWLTAATWFDTNVWIPISTAATSAWETVSAWWGDNIAAPVSRAWESVSEFFRTLFGSTEVPGSIAAFANDAWVSVSTWWSENILTPIKGAWEAVSDFFKDLFGGTEVPGSIASFANDAWCEITKWWEENIVGNITAAWEGVTGFFSNLIGDSEHGIIGFFSALWADISLLWGDIVGNVQTAWGTIGKWFYDNVTMPVGNFFIDCINGIIRAINWVVDQLNSINVTIPAVNGLWNETRLGFNIGHVAEIPRIESYATGGYDIPRGDLFIANEAGAELVGSMNGKTAVANQNQIVEGIQAGVRSANEDQNSLLREQNRLLRELLNKPWEVNPSATWGKFNDISASMWARQTGG